MKRLFFVLLALLVVLSTFSYSVLNGQKKPKLITTPTPSPSPSPTPVIPPENTRLRVCYHPFAPAVMDVNGVNPGIEVELLKLVAHNHGILLDFVRVPEFSDLIPTLLKDKCDIGMGGVSRTSERLNRGIRFGPTTLRSGTALMYRSRTENLRLKPKNLLTVVTSEALFVTFLLGLIAVAINGACICFLDWSGEFTSKGHWFEKWAMGCWRSVQFFTTAGKGMEEPTARLKIWSIVSWKCGLIYAGLVIYVVFSGLSLETTKYKIEKIQDISGKVVAVKRGTTSEDIAKSHNPKKIVYIEDSIEGGKKLLNNEVDVVVDDLPALLYLKKTEFEDAVEVEDMQIPQTISYILPPNSKHFDWLTYEIYKAQDYTEGGNKWAEINQKYLGK